MAAIAPDDPPDPDDPWGTESADCFYDNGSGDRANRRLPGGLSFTLPHEVYGAAQHGGPPDCEGERKVPSGIEEREPDWAPYATVSSAGGESRLIAKSGDFYYKYDARAEAGFVLMSHNAFAHPCEVCEVYRWLDEPPPGKPPLPPPPGLPPPPDNPERGPVGNSPKRAEHTKGKRGRKELHRERAEWYKQATGDELSGSLEAKNYHFDRVARRYRAYSDYRAQRAYEESRRQYCARRAQKRAEAGSDASEESDCGASACRIEPGQVQRTCTYPLWMHHGPAVHA